MKRKFETKFAAGYKNPQASITYTMFLDGIEVAEIVAPYGQKYGWEARLSRYYTKSIGGVLTANTRHEIVARVEEFITAQS